MFSRFDFGAPRQRPTGAGLWRSRPLSWKVTPHPLRSPKPRLLEPLGFNQPWQGPRSARPARRVTREQWAGPRLPPRASPGKQGLSWGRGWGWFLSVVATKGGRLQVGGRPKSKGVACSRHLEWAGLGLGELANPVGLVEINRASQQSWQDMKLNLLGEKQCVMEKSNGLPSVLNLEDYHQAKCCWAAQPGTVSSSFHELTSDPGWRATAPFVSDEAETERLLFKIRKWN